MNGRSRLARTLGSYLSSIGTMLDLNLPLFSKTTGNPMTLEGQVLTLDGEPKAFLVRSKSGELSQLTLEEMILSLTNTKPDPAQQFADFLRGYLNVQHKPLSSYRTNITRQKNGMPFKSLEQAEQAARARYLSGPFAICELVPKKVLL